MAHAPSGGRGAPGDKADHGLLAATFGLVLEELGGYEATLPIPNSFPQSQEHQEFNYVFLSTAVNGIEPPQGRFTSGPSLDGKSQFSVRRATPQGQEPKLGPPRPDGFAQSQQMQDGSGLIEKVVNKLTP